MTNSRTHCTHTHTHPPLKHLHSPARITSNRQAPVADGRRPQFSPPPNFLPPPPHGIPPTHLSPPPHTRRRLCSRLLPSVDPLLPPPPRCAHMSERPSNRTTKEWRTGLRSAAETRCLRKGLAWRVREETALRRTSAKRHHRELSSTKESVHLLSHTLRCRLTATGQRRRRATAEGGGGTVDAETYRMMYREAEAACAEKAAAVSELEHTVCTVADSLRSAERRLSTAEGEVIFLSGRLRAADDEAASLRAQLQLLRQQHRSREAGASSAKQPSPPPPPPTRPTPTPPPRFTPTPSQDVHDAEVAARMRGTGGGGGGGVRGGRMMTPPQRRTHLSCSSLAFTPEAPAVPLPERAKTPPARPCAAGWMLRRASPPGRQSDTDAANAAVGRSLASGAAASASATAATTAVADEPLSDTGADAHSQGRSVPPASWSRSPTPH